MIVSHKHKFIYIRPTKVAGSSVQVNLAKHCGKNDIVTSIRKFDERSDKTSFFIRPRNNDGFYGHMPPDEIRKRVGEKIWNEYFKFTIVRNPYDLMVSRYFWHWSRPEKKLSKELVPRKIKVHMVQPSSYIRLLKRFFKLRNKTFAETMKYFDRQWKNTNYYFDKRGKPICDFYIRYENLDQDYREICKKIKIPYEPLPKIKVKQRRNKRHYSFYYDDKTRKRVSKLFEKELSYFNYGFEQKIKGV